MPEVLWPAIMQSSSFLLCPLRSSRWALAALWGRALALRTLWKGSWQENWWAKMWSCQENLPDSGGEWTAVRCARPSSLSAGKSLQKRGALLLWLAHVVHNFSEIMCKKHLHSAYAFFLKCLEGIWCSSDKYRTIEGKILRLCLGSVKEIEKSVWEIE